MKNFLIVLLVAGTFAACNMGGSKNNATDDRIAKNKAGMQKFYDEVFNKHNPAMFDSCVTADYVEHEIQPGYPPTREGTKKHFADFFAAFPDINCKINFMVADTSYVVVQCTVTGTNTGSMMGMPATGKKMNVEGVDIVRFVNGKGVEHWGYREEMKMMMQMGMMPDMGGDNAKMKEDKKM